MQVGDIVEVQDRKNVLFKSKGLVTEIHAEDYPRHGRLVSVKTLDGRKCCVEPTALRVA